MSWSDYAVWWHVYPLGFAGAPLDSPADGEPVRHRLRRLEGWLDYAIELGCSGLMLGPIFASETHGYDTVDYFRIDPRLGDDADFDRLIEQAGRRGLQVVLDGVFNHVGRGFPRFVQALQEGPDTLLAPAALSDAGSSPVPAARWFRHHRGPDGSVVYDTFEGHDRLVTLNHEEPAVAEHLIAVMNHWLDRGAAGWRLDAAYTVPPGFWRRTLPAVRQRHPDAWFVGEMIHGDYAAYVAESGVDSVTQYELWKAIWSSLNDGNFFELAWALKRHNELLDTFTPLTFVGNHDVTRIASLLDERRHLGHALAVLFCVAGVPSIYYGDEQAFHGVKEHRPGGDDEIRPAFPDRPEDLAPYGEPVYRLHQRLIGLRRRHPWLVRTRTTAEHLTNRAMALVSAAPDELSGGPGGGPGSGSASERIVTLLNIDDKPYRFPAAAVPRLGTDLVVAEASDPDDASRRGDPTRAPLVVPPHSWRILTPAPSP